MTGIWLLSASPLPGQAREAAGTWRQQLVKLAQRGRVAFFHMHCGIQEGNSSFFARKTPPALLLLFFQPVPAFRTANEAGI